MNPMTPPFPDATPCFKKFEEKCANARRMGDENEENTILSDTSYT